VTNWVWDKSVPVAGEYTRENVKKYTRKHLPTLLVFTDVDWGTNVKRTTYYLNRLRKVATEKAREKFTFGVASKKAFQSELDKYGCDASKEFCVGIEDGANSGRYKYEGKEFNVDALQKFIDDFAAGALQPWIKSEPVPAEQGDVTVVVGKTFKDIVLDNKKDVLIELYAPWCGHCKNLEPAYKELGARIKKEGIKTVVIAKMDATANDVSNSAYQANGYPTILFAKAGSKNSPVKYEGGRDADSMFNWLKEKATGFKKDEL